MDGLLKCDPCQLCSSPFPGSCKASRLARAQRNYLVFRVNDEYVMGMLGEREAQR